MKELIRPEVHQFLLDYRGSPADLALGKSKFPGLSSSQLAQQLQGLRKAKTKLPSWHKNPAILYPPKISLEQSSSEATAQYKAKLVSGQSFVDITGGMGVDSYWFSKQFERVDYFELNSELAGLSAHNFKAFGAHNISVHSSDGLQGLKDLKPDWIFIDPSRRNKTKGKVYFLADCEPDMTTELDKLLGFAPNVMIKTSPMLDISQGLRELNSVKEIHVVAVQGEVKELLWICSREYDGPVNIVSSNLLRTGGFQSYTSAWTRDIRHPEMGTVSAYLYDPNPAMVKANQHDGFAVEMGLSKLAAHTHLYTDPDILSYPGRRFEVVEVLPYTKAILKKQLKPGKANVATRNFPLTVQEIRKKWKLQDGGEQFLFFVKDHQDQKIVVRAKRI
ncbi:THUMP-like domain-containing protein [Aureitalea marina]|uniref:Uncharacterized protein n=1 Tax=Aureitalea marina TaxID=930804 RepID=A0A2S7KP02_9FLAO|nr:SAM-dependent methyltransferase [Aureitalea marina]PQB04345.1 hypothetical protein BST85_05115 [Aureitalea marina]